MAFVPIPATGPPALPYSTASLYCLTPRSAAAVKTEGAKRDWLSLPGRASVWMPPGQGRTELTSPNMVEARPEKQAVGDNRRAGDEGDGSLRVASRGRRRRRRCPQRASPVVVLAREKMS
jgi:hypothetical protein